MNLFSASFAGLISILALAPSVSAESPSYAITWTTPSQDSLDSMPLSGRMGAGANVWVQDGSIWLYLAHNGAYDSRGRLLKLGSVRITPKDANLGAAGFSQTLDPATGTITMGQGEGFKARLWFAGETLVFESESATPIPLEISFGTWREKTKDGIRNDMMGNKTMFSPEKRAAAKKDELKRWDEFWNRSHIHINLQSASSNKLHETNGTASWLVTVRRPSFSTASRPAHTRCRGQLPRDEIRFFRPLRVGRGCLHRHHQQGRFETRRTR